LVLYHVPVIWIPAVHAGMTVSLSSIIFELNEYIDAYALHNVKHVFILAAILCGFFLFAVAVQVEDVNLVEGFQQVLTHLPMDNAVDKAVIGNIRQYAFAVLFDKM
jgi:hypothetical protein